MLTLFLFTNKNTVQKRKYLYIFLKIIKEVDQILWLNGKAKYYTEYIFNLIEILRQFHHQLIRFYII